MLALLLAAMQVGGTAPATPLPPAAQGAIDWAALPALPYRQTPRPTPPMMRFVADEMHRAACPRPAPISGRTQVRVDVAVLIGVDGLVRATIPRAIGCPTVEQYAAGLVVSYARGNLIPRLVAEGSWYRAAMVFDWAE